jgi:hypothetical protein
VRNFTVCTVLSGIFRRIILGNKGVGAFMMKADAYKILVGKPRGESSWI